MKFRDAYWFLSNMFPTKVPMNLGGKDYIFNSAEAAFQAQKNPALAEQFAALTGNDNGFKARNLGRTIPFGNGITKESWNNSLRVDAMRNAVSSKFNNNPNLMQQLQNISGNIAEDNTWGDTFWGVDITTGKGSNILGKMLMDIRDSVPAKSISTTGYERLKEQYADLIRISNMAGQGQYRTNYGPNTFKVDRRSSVLGNPFSMQDESQRMDVLNQYYDYFKDITSHNIKGQPFPEDALSQATQEAMASLNTPYWINKRGGSTVTGQSFMDELRRIAGKAKASGQPIELADWCAPNACHAETIGNFIGPYITPADISTPIDLSNNQIQKVISGGQTGADILGLQLAQNLGIKTGGTISKGPYGQPFLIESNDNIDRSKFGFDILDFPGNIRDAYVNRTNLNAANADGTVYFRGPDMGSGLIATQRAANAAGKPFLDNPNTADELYDWIVNNNIRTLNVAGNRGSKFDDATKTRMTDILNDVFKRPYTAAQVLDTVGDVTPTPIDDIAAKTLKVADVINHPTLGEGLVTGINDGIADIDFNGTTKHLSLQWLIDNILNKKG